MHPLEEFGENLFKVIDEYNERPGCHCTWKVTHSLVDDEPIDGCTTQHRGPQTKIELIMTDMKRANEFASAYYGNYGNREPISVHSWEGTE